MKLQSKVNSLVLDNIVNGMWPLYTVEKPSFKNLMTGLAPKFKGSRKKDFSCSDWHKNLIEVEKAMTCDFELTTICFWLQTFRLPTTKANWEWVHIYLTQNLKYNFLYFCLFSFKGGHVSDKLLNGWTMYLPGIKLQQEKCTRRTNWQCFRLHSIQEIINYLCWWESSKWR